MSTRQEQLPIVCYTVEYIFGDTTMGDGLAEQECRGGKKSCELHDGLEDTDVGSLQKTNSRGKYAPIYTSSDYPFNKPRTPYVCPVDWCHCWCSKEIS